MATIYKQLADELVSATNHPMIPPEIIPILMRSASAFKAIGQCHSSVMDAIRISHNGDDNDNF